MMMVFLIVGCCFLLSQGITASNATVPVSEMDALYDLYQCTNGKNWVWKTGDDVGVPWNFTASANPCTEQWQGIDCTPGNVSEYYHILSIYLSKYHLVGPLPQTLVQLELLRFFDVNENQIHGTLPSTYGLFSYLEHFNVAANLMSGTLPDSFGNLTSMTFLNLEDNRFSGSIPESWLNLQEIRNLRLHTNCITGTIPDNIDVLSHMIEFGITQNKMSGTLPKALFTIPSLAWVYVNVNRFTGSIPEEFAQMTQLYQFACDANHLTGRLPTLTGMFNLNAVAFCSNHFTGTLSNSIGEDCTQLTYFQTQQNLLTGTIPSNIGNLVDLLVFFAYGNMHTGSLPPSVSDMVSLTSFDVSSNRLTGPVPSLAAATLLSSLQLNNNAFTGSLDGMLNADTQPVLDVVVVNNNRLTGSLPEEIFTSKTLQVFVANVNCFHGSVSAAICEATSLSALVLDGLRSDQSCRSRLIANSYEASKRVHGQIPHCLFQLPNLTSLHLAGNGLTGSLPGDLPVSPSLFDLTVSHNRLTGSIPMVIQQRAWLTLDMSYNRLNGELRSDFSSTKRNFSAIADKIYAVQKKIIGVFNDTLIDYFNISVPALDPVPRVLLENNRLSGKIPVNIKTLSDVSILGTNLFTCKLDGSDLPPADNGGDHYQCGSSAFDIPYYVWLALTGAVGTALLLVWWHPHYLPNALGGSALGEKVRSWVRTPLGDAAHRPALRAFEQLLYFACACAVAVAACAVVVLLPMYAVLSVYYGKYTYEYAWTVSAAFLSGRVPFAVVMVVWVILLILAVAGMLQAHTVLSAGTDRTSTTCDERAAWTKESMLTCLLLVVTNLLVVVGVNVAYVYIAIYENSALLIFAQIGLSLFKLMWSSACTSRQVQLLTERFVARSVYLSVQVFVALLNNIVIPCFVVAIVSPDCFYNALVRAPTVTSDYVYKQCQQIDIDLHCVFYRPVVQATEFDPPFIYSYQCSSSIITYYAPAFVSLCAISAFLWPAIQLVAQQVYHRSAQDSAVHRLVGSVLAPALQLQSSAPPQPVLPATVCNVSRLMVLLGMYLGLLMTFGVVFPPLAVALAVAVCCASFFARCVMGRFVAIAKALENGLADVVEKDCQAVGSPLVLVHNVLWMVVTVSCWFYTLFLFDTLGDAVGFEGAYWVLIVMPIMPALLALGFYLHAKKLAAEEEIDKNAEMDRKGTSIDRVIRAVHINPIVDASAAIDASSNL